MVMATVRPQSGMLSSRVHVEDLSDPTKRSVVEILHATDACDFVRAAAITFARARFGEDVSAEIITQILPGVRDTTLAASLCAIATGDRATALMTCVRDRMFPESAEASPIEVVVLYAAWRAGASAQAIAPEARRLSRRKVGALGFAMLYTIGAGIGDDNVHHVTKLFRVMTELGRGPEFLASLDRILATPRADFTDALPTELLAQPVASGYTVRIAPRAGRNEPCACGSGRKFKRCCVDKQSNVTPSPVAGKSWDEYVTGAADKMSGDDLRGLPLRDLVRVDLHGLGDLPLVAAIGRFTKQRLFAHAERAATELARRDVDFIDDLRDEIVAEALEAGDLDTATSQLRSMKDPATAGMHHLEVELRTGGDGALALLAQTADRAVHNGEAPAALDLAHPPMRAMPGLGILVARGCIRSGRTVVNSNLLHGIEETRDALNLPSGDPAWDLHASLNADEETDDGDVESEKIAAEANALRGSLRDASSRLVELERELRLKQAQLDLTPKAAQPVAIVDSAERERLRTLRLKVDELEGLVRAGNAERMDLRRQLATASSTIGNQAKLPSTATEEDVDDLACEPIVATHREVAIPSVPRRAQDALEGVPSAVAAEALRTIGTLCAGDIAAWRRVKQAKEMVRPILMARIGIHYRLLFRVESRTLELVDLVPRSSLLATLKRLRSARA